VEPARTAPAVTEPAAAAIRASFEELFRAQFVTTARLAHLLGADDPEDVAQEAFVRLHSHWAGLRDRSGSGGYLRTTVVNLVRSRRQHLSMAARRTPASLPENVPSAETDAVLRAGNADLMAALGRIAPRHREALVLRFWLDLSERQIAEAMDISAGSVKSHVSRGLSALRMELAGEATR
jgi:RNA polymerase sigma factor (sigma-70 family)